MHETEHYSHPSLEGIIVSRPRPSSEVSQRVTASLYVLAGKSLAIRGDRDKSWNQTNFLVRPKVFDILATKQLFCTSIRLSYLF